MKKLLLTIAALLTATSVAARDPVNITPDGPESDAPTLAGVINDIITAPFENFIGSIYRAEFVDGAGNIGEFWIFMGHDGYPGIQEALAEGTYEENAGVTTISQNKAGDEGTSNTITLEYMQEVDAQWLAQYMYKNPVDDGVDKSDECAEIGIDECQPGSNGNIN